MCRRERRYTIEERAAVVQELRGYVRVVEESGIAPCPSCGGAVGVAYLEERNYLFRCGPCGRMTILRAGSEQSAIDTFNAGTPKG